MNNTTITTGMVRMSYVHLLKPYAPVPGNPEKFSVTMLIPKTDTATKQAVDAALEAAKQNGIAGKWGGTAPAVVQTPVHDGDGLRPNGEQFGPECRGCWVITANANEDHRPQVVDASLQPILDPNEIYSGMYGRVNINFFAYSFAGKKGIGCGLGPVQKLKDGEALGGAAMTPQQAFGAPVQGAGVNPITGQPAAGVNPITGQPVAGGNNDNSQNNGYVPF